VGPSRIAYGTIIAAGTIQRGDVDLKGQLVQAAGALAPASQQPFDPCRYGTIRRLILRNLEYCGQIIALKTWYETVRVPFMTGNEFHQRAAGGLLKNVELIYAERIQRLKDVTDRIQLSLTGLRAEDSLSAQDQEAMTEQNHWVDRWPDVAARLQDLAGEAAAGGPVLNGLKNTGRGYLATIQSADEETRKTVRDWLQSIVDSHTRLWDSVAL
jgi:UDP-N-acetylglucosamine/UDP-N-acetylgalactosamine diphosphorylase